MLARRFFLAFLFIFVLTPFVSGSHLPAVQVQDLEGNLISTSEITGEYLILDIWASWCPPCVVAMKDYQSNLSVFEERGIQLVAISVDDSIRPVLRFVEEHTITFSVFHDFQGGVLAWPVRVLPTIFLLSPDGTILLLKEGYSSFEGFWQEVEEALEEYQERLLHSSEDANQND